jgi:poly(hydroxyalkanoate) granule-associated protein
MLKKTKASADNPSTPSSPGARDLSQTVLDSSRQIWLAGLGAFSRAKGEGMRMFDTLVKQGEVLEASTKKMATQTAAAARDAAQAKAKEMQSAASGTWDRLEQVFEDRVARALSKLGVHTQDDVQRLAERVDALSEAVNELIKTSGVKSPRQRPTKTATRTARTARTARKTAKAAPK